MQLWMILGPKLVEDLGCPVTKFVVFKLGSIGKNHVFATGFAPARVDLGRIVSAVLPVQHCLDLHYVRINDDVPLVQVSVAKRVTVFAIFDKLDRCGDVAVFVDRERKARGRNKALNRGRAVFCELFDKAVELLDDLGFVVGVFDLVHRHSLHFFKSRVDAVALVDVEKDVGHEDGGVLSYKFDSSLLVAHAVSAVERGVHLVSEWVHRKLGESQIAFDKARFARDNNVTVDFRVDTTRLGGRQRDSFEHDVWKQLRGSQQKAEAAGETNRLIEGGRKKASV